MQKNKRILAEAERLIDYAVEDDLEKMMKSMDKLANLIYVKAAKKENKR